MVKFRAPSSRTALHPEREPLEILKYLREALGEYNFAAQCQQSPAPLGGGLVKAEDFPVLQGENVTHDIILMEPLHNQRGVDEHTKTAKPNTERVGYSNPPKHTRFKNQQTKNS